MGKYKRLNINSRMRISSLLEAGFSIAKIAEKMGVHRSTIYRELKRNSKKNEYCWLESERKYNERFKRCRRTRLIRGKFRIYIVEKLRYFEKLGMSYPAAVS